MHDFMVALIVIAILTAPCLKALTTGLDEPKVK